jgi:hypothetical protein
MGTQLHVQFSPRIEVVSDGDGSAGALGLTNRPVLLEGSSTDDGWLVGTGALVDIVGGAVADNRTLLGGSAGWVVGSEVLDDVVFDQGVLGPSVDGEVAVAVWLVSSGEVDCADTI